MVFCLSTPHRSTHQVHKTNRRHLMKVSRTRVSPVYLRQSDTKRFTVRFVDPVTLVGFSVIFTLFQVVPDMTGLVTLTGTRHGCMNSLGVSKRRIDGDSKLSGSSERL